MFSGSKRFSGKALTGKNKANRFRFFSIGHYYDATPHVEFLYACVEQTIEIDLPQEINFLERYDQFRIAIESLIEMPASTIDLLFHFLKQNEGRLSKRATEKEFAALNIQEIAQVERIYAELFAGLSE